MRNILRFVKKDLAAALAVCLALTGCGEDPGPSGAGGQSSAAGPSGAGGGVDAGPDGAVDAGPDGMGNAPPLANAGADQQVLPGASTTLDGTASSDPDNDALTYAWTQTAGMTVTLDNPSAAQPMFVAPNVLGNLTFELVVNDGTQDSAADAVTIEVTSNPNTAPIANAGPDVASTGATLVVLDGSGSSDGNGDPLTYSWMQSSGPPVMLFGANSESPSFTAPSADASLTFELTVSDGVVTSAPDVVTIAVAGYDGTHVHLPDNPFLRRLPTMGQARDVAVSGNRAYVATFYGLEIVDITDPRQMKLLGALPLTDAKAVDVQGSFAYVVTENGSVYLHVVDVNDPALPVAHDWVGLFGILAPAVDVSGNHAYVSNGSNGLRIVDIANPDNISIAGNYNPPGLVLDAEVVGTTAYVAAGTDGLAVLDVSNPASPTGSIVHNTAGSTQGVAIGNNKIYLAASSDGLRILDLATYALHKVWSFGSYVTDVAANGDFAYFAIENSGLGLADATDPPNATYTIVDAETPNGLVFSNGSVYMATFDGLRVLKTGGPNGPQYIAQDALGQTAKEVDLQGDRAAVGIGLGGLRLYDATVAGGLTQVGAQDTPTAVTGIDLEGAAAAIADVTTVLFYDVSTPGAINLLGTFDPTGDVSAVDLRGTRAYLAADTQGLLLLDVSTFGSPVLLGERAPSADRAHDVLVRDDLAFVATGTAGLEIVNVKPGSMPTLAGSLDTSGTCRAVALRGHYAILADSTEGAVVVDVSNPASPMKVASFDPGVETTDVFVYGDRLYVAYSNGIRVLDFSVPTSLRLLGGFNMAGDGQSVVATSDRVLAVGSDPMSGVHEVVLADTPANTALTLGAAPTTSPPGTMLSLQAQWLDRYPSHDEEVFCMVTGGTCTVSNVDQGNKQIQVAWMLPAATGAQELMLVVGNNQYFATAQHRVSVK